MPLTEEMKQLVLEGDNVALVFGTPQQQPILVFIQEIDERQTAEATEIVTRNLLDFCGLFAMVEDTPVVKCASVEAISLMGAAAITYTAYVAARMIAAGAPSTKKNDSVDWLERLMQLPDTRGTEKFGLD